MIFEFDFLIWKFYFDLAICTIHFEIFSQFWYWTTIITSDIVEEYNKGDAETRMYISLFLAQNGVSIDDFKTKKKITRYHRANVSFGIASYYFDYEF